jgi:hypothetical protein
MSNEPSTVENVYRQISEVLKAARATAYRQVNLTMVQAYWEVGRIIVEDEQLGEKRAEYGKGLINELSPRLTQEFGKGLDPRNLWYIRSFYLAFPILNALRSELSWTHYRRLIGLENHEARIWYMNEAANQNWSTRQLDRQIGSLYYERLVASRDNASVREEAAEKMASLQP